MKLSSVLGIAAAATAWLALPVSAQVQFSPSLAAEGAYSDNLAYAGTGASSDTAYRLSVDLPITRSWRTGGFQFGYNAGIYRFQDNSALDRTDHVLSFGVQSDFSRRTSVSFDTGFWRGQSQANFVSLTDPDIILTQRTNRDTFNVNVAFDFQVAPRWSWNVGAGIGSVRHEAIPGFSGGGLPVQDRDYTHASTGFGRQVSRKTTVGFDLQYLETRLEGSGDEQAYNAGLFVSRQVDRKSSLSLGVGAFSTKSKPTPCGAPPCMIAGRRSGVSVRFSYTRTFRRVSLGTFIGHQPTPGGNLPGTSTNTNVGVSISGVGMQAWLWSLSGQFTRRDPTDPALPEIDSRGFSGNLTWHAQPKIGLRLSASTVKQSGPTAADTEVFRATLGVVWFPKGQPGRNRA